jgi:hypothetical protein
MTPMWIPYGGEGHPMKRLLPILTLLAVLPAFSTGCSGLVADVQMPESWAKSPNVSYADAWACEVAKVPNTKGVMEECGACVMVTAARTS